MSRRKTGGWTEVPEEQEEAGAPQAAQDDAEVQVYTPGSLPKKKNRSVFGYLVILFVVAFLMLVLAFLTQERTNNAQVDALQYSLDTIQSMEDLVNENRALREENEALKKELAELQTQSN